MEGGNRVEEKMGRIARGIICREQDREKSVERWNNIYDIPNTRHGLRKAQVGLWEPLLLRLLAEDYMDPEMSIPCIKAGLSVEI